MAGIPTYSLIAEADAAVAIRGALELETAFPAALRERAPTRWRFCRDFSLYHAAMHATRVNAVAAIGQTCRAVLEEAHARCCADGRWVMNEKHLIDAAELTDVNEMFNGRANDDAELARLVADVGVRLRTMP